MFVRRTKNVLRTTCDAHGLPAMLPRNGTGSPRPVTVRLALLSQHEEEEVARVGLGNDVLPGASASMA